LGRRRAYSIGSSLSRRAPAPRAGGLAIKTGAPRGGWLHLVVIAAPALLYYFTACRTPGWADATLVVSQVCSRELSSWVDTHSLFNLLGHLWLKLFSADDVHFHVVLLSGVFGVACVYFVFRAVLELTSEVISAGTSALVLTVSHSLWWHSTMVEAYSLNAAIIALMLWLIFRYERTSKAFCLYLAAFSWGLGCTNHLLMTLFIPAFLSLVAYRIVRPLPHGGRHIGIAILCFLVGISFYLVLFFGRMRGEMLALGAGAGTPWMTTGWQAFRTAFDASTGGEFRKLMFAPGMAAATRTFWYSNFLFWFVANFPSAALPAGLVGIWMFWKKRWMRLGFLFFLSAILVQAVWSANYFVWDMYAFAMPVYVLFSIPVGLGVERVLRSGRAMRVAFLALLVPTLLMPGFLYSQIPKWYRAGGFFRRFFDNYPQVSWTAHTWDPVEYVVNPRKRTYDKVERYARAVFALLPTGAHLLNSDCRSDYPLRYYYRDLYGQRTDIVHHSLYSPWMTPEMGRAVARELKEVLDLGGVVYSASVLYPEKVVLDQLALLYDRHRLLDSLQGMSEEEYAREFPRVDLQRIVLDEAEAIWLYRLVPRRP
jgi:hypothetical protein